MPDKSPYSLLKEINTRPEPYSRYTADILWTGEHISKKMLEYHLNPDTDLASRKPEFIDKSVAWMAGRFGINKETRIADFGCGPGLYTSRFAKLGASVTGIDFSASSLAFARKQAEAEHLDITYINANYLEYEAAPESYDLISLIYCDLCPLSPAQRGTMLNKFRRLLAPKGSLILDVWTHKFFDSRNEETSYEPRQMNGFWAEGDYFGFHNVFKYNDIKLTLDKYTIIEPSRSYSVYNWLQCYTPVTLKTELAAAGFEVKEIYGDVSGSVYSDDSPCMAVIATRTC